VLLTRSPLSPGPKARFSLDLHVLSAPPAFVLSQDQTLREEWLPAPEVEKTNSAADNPHFELLAQRSVPKDRRGVDVLSPTTVFPQLPDQVSTLEERSLLSFQRPVPLALTA
jgi:hypothetical protein